MVLGGTYDEEARQEVQCYADDEAGEDAEGGLEGGEVLDFLEAVGVCVSAVISAARGPWADLQER